MNGCRDTVRCVWGIVAIICFVCCQPSSKDSGAEGDGGNEGDSAASTEDKSDTDEDTASTSDNLDDTDDGSEKDTGKHYDTENPDGGFDTDTDADTDTTPDFDGGLSTDSDGDAGLDSGSETETDSDDPQDTETASDTVVPPSDLTVEITSPDNGVLVEAGKTVSFQGKIADSQYEETTLSVIWRSDVLGVLGSASSDGQGNVSLPAVTLPLGWHVITLEVENPSEQKVIDAIMVGVCKQPQIETFDENIQGWKIYGDAYWEGSGWLELTGTSSGKKGWIFKTSSTVNPGDVTISFSIRTGGGINSGADGFALSVFNVESVSELESVIQSASAGGCLGYGVAHGCGNPEDLEVEAFHIEIDTWYNSLSQGHPIGDPSSSNHIAITLNGSPHDHVLWHAVPSIEDNKWHDLAVVISGSHVKMTLDNVVIIDDEAPGLEFRGGYLGFSGSTGWATNWHSIDNVEVDQGCEVP